MDADVVIVGAGLAGLTCARRLQELGRSSLVLDAADAVGGRVRTDEMNGFRLDRGFQVLLTAYPEARRWLDYAALDLQPFVPGALVWTGRAFVRVTDPRRRPGDILRTATSPVGSFADKLRLLGLVARSTRGEWEGLLTEPEVTASALLQSRGISPAMIRTFLRPWLGGVFLDPTLMTSSRMLKFVLRMFAEGNTAVPQRGMQQIPEQLAARLPAGSIRLRTRVQTVTKDAVTLASGASLRASAVVVAADLTQASQWEPGLGQAEWRGVVNLQFAAPESPTRGEPILVLNGTDSGIVNDLAVMSDASAAYAPPGRSLISVSVLKASRSSDLQIVAEVKRELGGWWGDRVASWELLRVCRVPEALPKRWPLERDLVRRSERGFWLAGDHLSTASIQGAMESGRATADAIVQSV